MEKSDSVAKVLEFIRLHKAGLIGSLYQEPYTSDLMRIFAEAYNAGFTNPDAGSNYLSADVLADEILSTNPEYLDLDVWSTLRNFWMHWTYAWNHSHLNKLK